MNRVFLLGNLGADPELRHTKEGTPYLRFRVATTGKYLDRGANEWKERTEWHSVVLWGKRGETLCSYLRKGDRVMVEGSLRTSSYERDGQKHHRTEVRATELVFAGSRRASGTERAAAAEAGVDALLPERPRFGDARSIEHAA
jgi:single-strand DNA-binding protein